MLLSIMLETEVWLHGILSMRVWLAFVHCRELSDLVDGRGCACAMVTRRSFSEAGALPYTAMDQPCIQEMNGPPSFQSESTSAPGIGVSVASSASSSSSSRCIYLLLYQT